MTLRYVLASQLFQLKKHKQFCKKSLLGQKKWQGTTIMALEACELMKGLPQKLKTHVNTLFASKVVLFQETLEFKHVIFFTIEVNNNWFYMVMYILPKFGQ